MINFIRLTSTTFPPLIFNPLLLNGTTKTTTNKKMTMPVSQYAHKYQLRVNISPSKRTRAFTTMTISPSPVLDISLHFPFGAFPTMARKTSSTIPPPPPPPTTITTTSCSTAAAVVAITTTMVYLNKNKIQILRKNKKKNKNYNYKNKQRTSTTKIQLRKQQQEHRNNLTWLSLAVLVGLLSPSSDSNQKQQLLVNKEIMVSNENLFETTKKKTTFTEKLIYFMKCFVRISVLMCYGFPLLVLTPLLLTRFNNFWWSSLCFSLEGLGGSWIKLGQWASTRRDIFSEEFISNISHLCRQCPTHPFEDTVHTIESTYSQKLTDLFSDFSDSPIASGAVAQVHTAKLRSTGERVAVKVLHPYIREMIELDLDLLRRFVRLVEIFPGTKWLSLSDAADHFSENMRKQVDLRIEAKNLEKFSQNFRDSNDITFPKIIPSIPASEQVLVESFEEGDSLLESEVFKHVTPQSKKVAKIGLNAYLKMMLLDNFVHADLHPGNILVRNENRKLRLVFLDVGLVCQASPSDWVHFKELFKSVVEGNGQHGARMMVRFAREKTLTPVQEEKFTTEIDQLFSSVRHKKLSEIDVGHLIGQILSTVRKHNVKIEGNFATLCVGTVVVEGIGKQLDPDINLLDASVPLLAKADMVSNSKKTRMAIIEKLQKTYLETISTNNTKTDWDQFTDRHPIFRIKFGDIRKIFLEE